MKLHTCVYLRIKFQVSSFVDDLHLYLKCHSSTGIFETFATENQLPALFISGTLTENGLI